MADAVIALPIEQPRRDGPPLPPQWRERYIEEVTRTGGLYRAAERVGVNYTTTLRYRNADPEFDRQVLEARELAADDLEEELVDQARRTDNPVGYIVRLKALRPMQYIERHAVMNVSVDLHAEITETAALSLLRDMFNDATDATRMLVNGRELGQGADGVRPLDVSAQGGETPESSLPADDGKRDGLPALVEGTG